MKQVNPMCCLRHERVYIRNETYLDAKLFDIETITNIVFRAQCSSLHK